MPELDSRKAPPAGRAARRRQRTRAKLMAAARAVMARKGVDTVTIQEITDEADVGFGSFYNHFDSKEAIVEAILAETVETFGDALDRIADAMDDPAEVLAASIRYAVRRAAADPDWGWFLVHTGLSAHRLRAGLGRRMARDIRLGIESGRFRVGDPEASVLAVGGSVLAIMAARLDGALDDGAPERAAAVALAFLGIPHPEAVEIARRPLPPIDLREQSPLE